MLKNLSKIFPSLIINPKSRDNLSDECRWFYTTDNQIIGIHKEDLTKQNNAILDTFLTPLNKDIPIFTSEELEWKKLVSTPTATSTVKLNHPFRFVFFSIIKKQIEPKLFNEAIYELFSKYVPIIWKNDHEGIIIEEQSTTEDTIAYEQIIDVLMSDLYVKIKFLVGPTKNDLSYLDHYYKKIVNAAEITFKHSKKRVITYINAIPYVLINQADSAFRSEMTFLTLNEITTDKEMLKTLEVFFECNLNVTATAKQMYMHRNSLQYRIDKFINKTGINIQNFDEALTVYLAILSNNSNI